MFNFESSVINILWIDTYFVNGEQISLSKMYINGYNKWTVLYGNLLWSKIPSTMDIHLAAYHMKIYKNYNKYF